MVIYPYMPHSKHLRNGTSKRKHSRLRTFTMQNLKTVQRGSEFSVEQSRNHLISPTAALHATLKWNIKCMEVSEYSL